MTSADIVRLHELRMQGHAALFDLRHESERRRSAHNLVNLYFDLVRLLSPPLFIEAGARGAEICFEVRKFLPMARIVAFEPSPITSSITGGSSTT